MAERNYIPLSELMRPSHEGRDDSVFRHPHRRLTPAEVHIIEDRIASQSREIETLVRNNQGLAATHVALKQDVAAAQQDLRRHSATVSAVKAERDAQVREVYERSLKLEAEARSLDGLSAELDRVRAEIKELRDERMGLAEKLKVIEGDISSTQPELQEFSDLKTDIEAWQREIRRGRVAVDYERKMQSTNLELSEAMEKHMMSMAHEAEKLRTELENTQQRATIAVVGAVPAANHGSGYAIQQPGYANAIQQPGYANSIQQPGYANAIQQPGYANAIQQPGYGENLLSDPHVVQPLSDPPNAQQPGYGENSFSDTRHVQPGYGGNTLSDPHVAQQPGHGENSLSDAHVVQPGYGENSLPDARLVQPGCGVNSLPDARLVQSGCGVNTLSDPHVAQQPGHGENSLSDPHVIQPGYGGNMLSDPRQPGYGENSLSDPHVVQPVYFGNMLSDPHAAHQEKAESKHLKMKRRSRGLNKKRKVETNPGEKKPICANCQKNHRGECLKGKKVCFKCKEPGHISSACTVVSASTQEEAKHVIKD